MNVFTRVCKMTEAVWNDAVERIAPSQAAVDGLERRYEEAVRKAIELRQHAVSAEEMATLRGEQAELAMRAGEESLARLALQEKQREEAAAELYREQYAHSQHEVLELAERLAQARAAAEPGAAAGEAGVQGAAQSGERPLTGAGMREGLRELGEAGKVLGREVGQALQEAGRVSGETLKEAAEQLRHELHAAHGKLRREWERTGYGSGSGNGPGRER
ncbi:hypothetical protein B5M42_013910 [Paenibacillus athensensis]|nr:hypothetical protein [Paenibacillus athensensis]MCD1259927.1 hypothetical protein [Paenibacillus athensensis]